ncbi:MAG: DUF3592 domain-containing protein, partial [Terracidiphilus sp.]
MDQIGKIFGLVFSLIGPVAIAYAIVSFIRTQRFVRSSAEAKGEVIRLEHTRDRLGSATYEDYAPVFSFTAADGRTYTVTSDIASSPADFSVGERVSVRY